MADQSDVEQAIAAIAAGILYPQGSAAASVVGVPCRVHRGWPDPAALDGDLAGGVVNVTVAADAREQRTTTRYPDEWKVPRPIVATLQVQVQGNVATFSGAAGEGQLAGLLADGIAAVHRTVSGDTPASVAAALAGALSRSTASLGTVSASGAAVTVGGVSSVVARVVADQPAIRETRRQRQMFRVVCWCPNPATRDAVATAIDSALSAIDFLGLPDGMAGRLRFVASVSTDRAQDAGLYRRDLVYSVDYATTLAANLPCLLFQDLMVSGNGRFIKSLLT